MEMASCPRLAPSGVTVQLSVVRTAKAGVEATMRRTVARAVAFARECIASIPGFVTTLLMSVHHRRASCCPPERGLPPARACRQGHCNEFLTKRGHDSLFLLQASPGSARSG